MPIFHGDFLRKIRSQDGSSIDNTLLPSQDEPEKVIITDSVLAALRRCAVHIVPIAVSITIMTLNIKGTYLGADLMSPVKSETINLLLLQLAAKAHEITIVSSLGIIVLQFVRHELLFGDGLPLGLLGSGITFNHFEFFFRKEFYGGLKYVARQGSRRHKIMFITLVILAGLIAALAGPASAVLVVPKSQDWKSGGTPFYLNGSESELWPDDLSGELPEFLEMCKGNNSTQLALCPAAGFYSLWTHWGTMNYTTFRTQDVRSYAKELSGSRFYWPVSSPSSLIPPLYILGNSQQGPNGGTSLVQPHAAAVVILQQLAEDWWDALTARNDLSDAQIGDRLVSAKFKNGMSIARCAKPQKLTASNKTIHFPSMDGVVNNFADNLPLNVGNLNSSYAKHLRFQWAHLPAEFGPASIGGLFESPWDKVNSSEAYRAVVACTIQAGWVPATVFTDKYTFWTGWYPWNILFGDRTPKWFPNSNSRTNGRVALGDDWLGLLTPPSPVNPPKTGSWTPSTIESMFLNAGLAADTRVNGTASATPDEWLNSDDISWQKVSLVEAIVCSVVLDGLSRTTSYRAFDTSGPGSKWPVANYRPLPDFKTLVLKNKPALQPPDLSPEHVTTIQAEMKTSGFSFQASLASFLAMSVLLVHIALALAHIIYVLCQRHTSTSWNSVAELIALSQNSQPAFGILSNTGGGIKRSSTYSRVARIRARKLPESPDHQHVELLFDDIDDHLNPQGNEAHWSSHELVNIRENPVRHPATWPNNPTSVALATDEYTWDSSTSTERADAQISLEAGQPTTLINVNCPYG